MAANVADSARRPTYWHECMWRWTRWEVLSIPMEHGGPEEVSQLLYFLHAKSSQVLLQVRGDHPPDPQLVLPRGSIVPHLSNSTILKPTGTAFHPRGEMILVLEKVL